jgi:hypothetical protein
VNRKQGKVIQTETMFFSSDIDFKINGQAVPKYNRFQKYVN